MGHGSHSQLNKVPDGHLITFKSFNSYKILLYIYTYIYICINIIYIYINIIYVLILYIYIIIYPIEQHNDEGNVGRL